MHLTIKSELHSVLEEGITSPAEVQKIAELQTKIADLPRDQQMKLMQDPFMQILREAIESHTGEERAALEALRTEIISRRNIEA